MTLVGQQHRLALFGSLEDNKLGPQGGAALAEALKGNTTLTSLECAAMHCTCQSGSWLTWPTSISSR